MQPNEILRLVEQAKLLAKAPETMPDAFVLSFVAWEGLKVRILVAALKADGHSVAESRAFIRNENLWKSANFDNAFAKLYGSLPSNSMGVGKVFRSLDRATKIRNAYVHGFSRTSPERFQMEFRAIIEAIESDWETLLNQLRRRNRISNLVQHPLSNLRTVRAKQIQELSRAERT